MNWKSSMASSGMRSILAHRWIVRARVRSFVGYKLREPRLTSTPQLARGHEGSGLLSSSLVQRPLSLVSCMINPQKETLAHQFLAVASIPAKRHAPASAALASTPAAESRSRRHCVVCIATAAGRDGKYAGGTDRETAMRQAQKCDGRGGRDRCHRPHVSPN